MARPSPRYRPAGAADGSAITKGWGSCLIAKHHGDRDKRLARAARRQNCRQQGLRRGDVDLSQSAVLTAPCSKTLARANGFNAHDNWRSRTKPASGKRRAGPSAPDTRRVATPLGPSINGVAPALRGPRPGAGRRGRHPRLMRTPGSADLLILDDWGWEPTRRRRPVTISGNIRGTLRRRSPRMLSVPVDGPKSSAIRPADAILAVAFTMPTA